MQKLIKLVSSVLNITFVRGKASKAGVRFVTNSYNGKDSISVFSNKYTNIYGRISAGMPTKAIKDLANNIAMIDTIRGNVKTKMKDLGLTPYGNWFVTSKSVMTTVVSNKEYFNFVYYLDGRSHQLNDITHTPKKGIPQLKKPIVKPIEFDYNRFNKYVDLVAEFRTTYTDVVVLKDGKDLDVSKVNLDDPRTTLAAIVNRARLLNGRKYKSTVFEEADLIIKKVEKIKANR